MGRRKASGKRSKNAKSSAAGNRGEHEPKTVFTGKYAQRAEERARMKEEKREDKRLRENAALDFKNKDAAKEPHSFVIHHGEVGKYVKRLVTNFREIMEPNTAAKLKVMKGNNIRDFVTHGAVLGVTHMIVFTRSERSVNMRIVRFSQGPTLTFRVKEYTHTRHIRSSTKTSSPFPGMFRASPLVVMSGFKENQPRHLQLVQTTFQNMFPTINVDMLNLLTVRRVLMVRYNEEDDTIDIRHYAIKTVPTGMSKSTKKLMQSKLPDLGKYKDIADFFINPGHLSDSGMEEESKEVDLAQDMSRGCTKGGQTQIRLIELGPRMTMDLLKVEQGIDEGEILYHKLVTKSTQEIEALRKKAPTLKKQRERRRRDEEHRVIRKLKRLDEERKAEQEQMDELREAAARKQAMATGQTEDIETNHQKDNEIAQQRERDGETEGPPAKRRRGAPPEGGEEVNGPKLTRKQRKELAISNARSKVNLKKYSKRK